MNFMTPHFRNLILIFKADTSSKLSCTTSGAAHPAVWRHRLTERGFPFTQHKCLCHTDINKIPRKNFIVASCSLGIKININATCSKCLQPQIIVKEFRPRIEKFAVFIHIKNRYSDLTVSARKDSFQYRHIGFMPVVTDTLVV